MEAAKLDLGGSGGDGILEEVTEEDLKVLLEGVGTADDLCSEDPQLSAVLEQVFEELEEGEDGGGGNSRPEAAGFETSLPSVELLNLNYVLQAPCGPSAFPHSSPNYAFNLALLDNLPTFEEVMAETETALVPVSKPSPDSVNTDSPPPVATTTATSTTATSDSNSNSDSPSPGQATDSSWDSRLRCSVCSAPANGFRYYGAVVCTSCRAFFSRAVKRGANLDFRCSTGRNRCAVDSKSWKSCQSCRYRRCVEAGMDIKRVKTGTAAAATAAADRQQQQSVSKSRSLVLTTTDPPPYSPPSISTLVDDLEHKLTLGDRQYMEEVQRFDTDFKIFHITTFFTRDLKSFELAMSMLFEGKRGSMSTYIEINSYVRYLIHKLIAQDPYRIGMKSRDRDEMMRRNYDVASALAASLALRCRTSMLDKDDVKLLMRTALKEQLRGDPDGLEACRRIYREKSRNGRRHTCPTTYDLVFPEEVFCGDLEAATRCRRLVEKLLDWPERLIQDHGFVVLLVDLAFCSTEGADLEDRRQAEAVEAKLVSLIYRYLKSIYSSRPGEAAALLDRVLSAIATARELGGIRRAYFDANRKALIADDTPRD